MNTKPKVLYISPNGYLGGAERFVLDLLEAHQNSQQIQVEVLFFHSGEALENAKKLGLPVHLLPIALKLSRPFSLLKSVLYLRREFKRIKPDILHLTMAYSHLVCFIAQLFLPIKTVWFQHGPVGGLLDRMAAWLPCDRLLFLSSYLQKEHNKMLSLVSKKRQRKVHALIRQRTSDPLQASQIRKRYLKGEQKLLLGSAGRICEWKGQHLILEALHKLPEGLLSEVHLIIIGKVNRTSDEPYLQQLKSMVEDYNLQENVTFCGFIKDIQHYYAAMDLFIHSSTIPEPFGLVVGEVMLQKTLVLGSSQGGVQEILEDNQTGVSYDSTDEHAVQHLQVSLLKVLTKLIEVPKAFDSIVENAYQLIQTQYNPVMATQEIEEIYLNELLDQSKDITQKIN